MELGIFFKKWSIAIKIVPLLIAIIILKFIIHGKGWEALTLSALFTSIVGATIFLIGFLISGVLSDYKESEKLPGELTTSLEALHDEASIAFASKKSVASKEFLAYHQQFMASLKDWLYAKENAQTILGRLSKMNDHFVAMEKEGIATSRMKTEQGNIRKIIIRMNVIRETSFVVSAYAIVEALIFILVIGMLLVKIEPFYESIFFVIIVSFLMLYMLFLIRDLDNPFDYKGHGESGSEVSLQPLRDLEERLKSRVFEEKRKK
jgi:hypothetical protein